MSEENNKKSKFDQVIERLETFVKRFEKSKFAEVTTTDDSILSYEGELEIGTSMFIMIEEEEVPLPEGTYTLVDGMTLTVDVEGVITEIVEAEASEDDAVVEEEVEATEEVETALSQDDLSKQLKELEDRLSSKFNADNSEMISLIKDMGKQLKTFGEQAPVAPKKKFERTDSKSDLSPRQKAILNQTKKG